VCPEPELSPKYPARTPEAFDIENNEVHIAWKNYVESGGKIVDLPTSKKAQVIKSQNIGINSFAQQYGIDPQLLKEWMDSQQ
jgi:hypothetical protein